MKTIPLELTTLNNWLTWHYEYKEGKEKPLKVPNVPKDWYNKPMKSFNEVVAEQANNNVGIGIAMTATNRIVGIDLDNIDDKAIPPKLKAILTIGKKGGYIERSVSKTGYHVHSKNCCWTCSDSTTKEQEPNHPINIWKCTHPNITSRYQVIPFTATGRTSTEPSSLHGNI